MSPLSKAAIATVCIAVSLAARAPGATYHVDRRHPSANDKNHGTAERPFKTIGRAAEAAEAGDTVVVKPGVYREAVHLRKSGRPLAPITFLADPAGSVVITGADVITGWEREPGGAPIYAVPWKHVFAIDYHDGKPVEHHPNDAPLWGRAEQVIVDGKQLLPASDLAALAEAWGKRKTRAGESVSSVGDPADPDTWCGMFAVDTVKKKRLYLWLADGSDPNGHRVEASTRGQIFGVNPWQSREGVSHVHVRGFIFRYAGSFPQRPAAWLHGRHNLMEDCLIEEMAGGGVGVGGVLRRCVVRRCGHTGGCASGTGFVNEENLWERNSWKPISRGWDAGGVKSCLVKGGVFRRCVFRRNGGPGLWLDIHVRNVLITECVFEENEGSGLFIEISRDITVVRNLAVGNALGVGDGGWSSGGIHLAESLNCIVAFNTCVGNKDGITIREQGPRTLETEDYGEVPYHNENHVLFGNVSALNEGVPLGLWYDNGHFGWHPAEKEKYVTEAAYEEQFVKANPDKIYDPAKRLILIDGNLYLPSPGKPVVLYGVPWRPRHKWFGELKAFAGETLFDSRSAVADPLFVDADGGDYRFRPESPAWKMQAGWLDAPADVDVWMRAFLPSFGEEPAPHPGPKQDSEKGQAQLPATAATQEPVPGDSDLPVATESDKTAPAETEAAAAGPPAPRGGPEGRPWGYVAVGLAVGVLVGAVAASMVLGHRGGRTRPRRRTHRAGRPGGDDRDRGD